MCVSAADREDVEAEPDAEDAATPPPTVPPSVPVRGLNRSEALERIASEKMMNRYGRKFVRFSDDEEDNDDGNEEEDATACLDCPFAVVVPLRSLLREANISESDLLPMETEVIC